MFTELKPALSIRELEKIKKNHRLSGRLAGLALTFLEKYFGAQILLDVPSNLQETDSELFVAIETAEKLQNLGIIKEIEKRPKFSDEPFLHRFFVTTQKTNNTGSGSDFFSEKAAIWKAIGEATERDLWATGNDILKSVLRLPYEKIASQTLDIFKLAGFSEEQKKNNSQLSFDKNTVFGWVPAVSLTEQKSDKNIFCPAQLINPSYFRKNTHEKKNEPILRRCITTGVATGNFLEEVIVKGILEIIERDAYIVSYLNHLSPPVIDFENMSYQDEELEKVYKMFQRYNLEVYLIKLPTDFSASVVSAVIIDRSGQGPAFALGNSAKLDLKSAVLGALTEALTIRLSLKKDWEIKKNLALPALHRLGQFDRMIYWARPENVSRLDFMTQGEKIQIDLTEEENFFADTNKVTSEKYYQEKLQLFIEELRAKSYEACYVELSNSAVRKLGLRSVQVVIPELQPIHLAEEFPCWGGRRLSEIPKKLGYIPADKPNPEPHPFG